MDIIQKRKSVLFLYHTKQIGKVVIKGEAMTNSILVNTKMTYMIPEPEVKIKGVNDKWV